MFNISFLLYFSRFLSIFLFLLLYVTFIYSLSEEKSVAKGLSIMEKVEIQLKIHKTQKSTIKLIITNKKNKHREKSFFFKKKIVQNKNDNTEQSTILIEFFKPNSVKGTRMLRRSKGLGEVEQWIYLPALKSVKKLLFRNKKRNFMGSDFTYGDISGRPLHKDTHYYKNEDAQYYYITNIPKNTKNDYAKLDLKINKKFMLLVEVKFYDSSNTLIKTLRGNKIEQHSGTYLVVDYVMENHKQKTSSRLLISDVKMGIPIKNAEMDIKVSR